MAGRGTAIWGDISGYDYGNIPRLNVLIIEPAARIMFTMIMGIIVYSLKAQFILYFNQC